MNELKVINEQVVLGKEFRIYGDSDNPLFLAKDVANWIEHSNSRMMLNSVDEDEKLCVNNPYALKGQQEQWFLTEDGLYEVLMQSRKPIAKSFKKEVKHILKTIRQTGSYTQKPLSTLEMIAQMAAEAAAQEKRLLEIEQKQVEVANEFTNIKETILINNQDWRNKVNRAINAIAKQRGGGREFQETRKESYELLEQRAKCRLEIRLNNMKKDALANGVISKNKIDGFNKMDVIENDTRLLEIYLSVVKEMSIAHHIDVNIINQ